MKRIKWFTQWKWGWRMVSSWVGSVAKAKEVSIAITVVAILDTLKKFNVDLQVYFHGVIIGPHCIILAERTARRLNNIFMMR